MNKDEKFFAWVRSRMSPNFAEPVILHDKSIGPKLEFVGKLVKLKPNEYTATIKELVAIYPMPVENGE